MTVWSSPAKSEGRRGGPGRVRNKAASRNPAGHPSVRSTSSRASSGPTATPCPSKQDFASSMPKARSRARTSPRSSFNRSRWSGRVGSARRHEDEPQLFHPVPQELAHALQHRACRRTRWKSSRITTTLAGSWLSPDISRRRNSSWSPEAGHELGQRVGGWHGTDVAKGGQEVGPEPSRLVVTVVEGHPRDRSDLRLGGGPLRCGAASCPNRGRRSSPSEVRGCRHPAAHPPAAASRTKVGLSAAPAWSAAAPGPPRWGGGAAIPFPRLPSSACRGPVCVGVTRSG